MAAAKGERRPPKQRAVVPGFLAKPRGLVPVAIFAACVIAGAVAIQFLGDPSAAGPRKVVALEPAVADDGVQRLSFSDVAAPLGNLKLDDLAPAPEGPVRGHEPASAIAEDASAGEVRIALVQTPTPARNVQPLPRAPFVGLTEQGPLGPLPIVARDGRMPSQAYARPFQADRRPKISIVVGGLGFNARTTTQAIDELPPEVTLSFVPYAARLQPWIDQARASGHEVMLELPMEPFDPAADDTGPQTLLAAGTPAVNTARLENLLSRGAGYFGVTNYQGARFAASAQAAGPVVQQIRRRGLVFFTSGIGQRSALSVEAARAGLQTASADRIVDARREADAISEQLLSLETLARQNGSAIGAGFAYPVTMEQIATWARDLDARGFTLAPVSAVLFARTQAR
ncbi:MAG: divergent polysaccharide deacetylase family protein [Hyphomonadaceae bacterium]|nr:divergent polysaccharide deacetylase family protein [Hyphomonadaceae bacterium]